MSAKPSSPRFPRSARLVKPSDFKFVNVKRYGSESFSFYFTRSGSGRLGISVAKRVLRNASDRNRAKRLIRESFRVRRARLDRIDVNVVAHAGLAKLIDNYSADDVGSIFDAWMSRL